MRAGIFRTPRFRVVAPVLLALLATLTPSASAQSLFKYAPATQWGYTFAGPATKSPSGPAPKGATHLPGSFRQPAPTGPLAAHTISTGENRPAQPEPAR